MRKILKFRKLTGLFFLAAVLSCGCAVSSSATKSESRSLEESGKITAESLGLADGSYEIAVSLEGGSGKASVHSPALLKIKNGTAKATLAWNSSHFDYMKIGDVKYMPLGSGGNSTFEIPVDRFDDKIPVIADTTAMSTSHEIEYTLLFDSASLSGSENGTKAAEKNTTGEKKNAASGLRDTQSTVPGGRNVSRTQTGTGPSWDRMTKTGSMDLTYAECFTVDRYDGGYRLITIKDGGRFLVVPENAPVPSDPEKDIVVLQQPLSDIYLAATSAMDFYRVLDGISDIRFSAVRKDDWYIEEAKAAMADGSIAFAGKYNAPDYEQLSSGHCSLALESTMILHSPDVKEKLENLGIPVLVERSSYESNPLGRMEWLKLYGVLLGKEDQAEQIFRQETGDLEDIIQQKNTEKTVAFFSITSNGAATVRRPGDYVTKMIEMAGGKYIFDNPSDDGSALSTMNMQIESFYSGAKDADCIIYNSTIEDEPASLRELLAKSSVLSNFRAVKEGHVWTVGRNLFQETTKFGEMIQDIHVVLTEENPDESELTFLHRLS